MPIAPVINASSHPRPRESSASSLLRSAEADARANADDIIFSESSNKNCTASPSPLLLLSCPLCTCSSPNEGTLTSKEARGRPGPPVALRLLRGLLASGVLVLGMASKRPCGASRGPLAARRAPRRAVMSYLLFRANLSLSPRSAQLSAVCLSCCYSCLPRCCWDAGPA